MLWIASAVAVAAGVFALFAAIFSRRGDDVGELGELSSRWIAEHRVDSH